MCMYVHVGVLTLQYLLQDFLKGGYIVQVISKLCGKSLRVLENGVVDCAGDAGTACELVHIHVCVHIPTRPLNV